MTWRKSSVLASPGFGELLRENPFNINPDLDSCA
jgi:hypothetical protein